MTALALHSGNHFVQRELPSKSRVRGVAPEAAQFIVAAHEAPGSFVDVRWGRPLGTQCRTKTIQLAEIADAALIDVAVSFQKVSLANCRTRSHRPPDRHGHRLDSIGNRIAALAALALDPVRVPSHLRSKNRAIDENLALLNGLERVRHGSGRLGPRLRVTWGARRHAARIGLRCRGCRKD